MTDTLLNEDLNQSAALVDGWDWPKVWSKARWVCLIAVLVGLGVFVYRVVDAYNRANKAADAALTAPAVPVGTALPTAKPAAPPMPGGKALKELESALKKKATQASITPAVPEIAPQKNAVEAWPALQEFESRLATFETNLERKSP